MPKFFFISICALVASTFSIAFAAIDLDDFDTDAMRALDDASKELESAIAGSDARASTANAEFVRASLRWAEGYFIKKGNAAKAVQWARDGQQFATRIASAVNSNDFDAAYGAFISLKKTCKSCHDTYKPPSI